MSQSTKGGPTPDFEVPPESGDEHDDPGGTADEDHGNGAEALPLDVVFDMLKNERRRTVLKYVRREDGPFTLSELAEHIAALENDKEIQALNSSERKRVYVGLYQCHLPRMSDAGVIEFDRNRGTVEVDERAEQLYPYIDVDEDEGTWVRVSAVAAAVFGVGLLLGILVPFQPLALAVVPGILLLGAGFAVASDASLFGD